MAGINATMVNFILDAMYPNSGTTTVGAKTITGAPKVRLMTANGSDSAAGTELGTSGGYTAGGSAIASWASAASGAKATSVAVTWNTMPVATIVGVEMYDAGGTPLRMHWGSITTVTTASGDTLTISSGALVVSIA